MQDFVPAHHDLVVLGDDLLQPLVEVSLQVLIVFHAVSMNEFLNLRIRVPLLAVDFVAADVEVRVGKKLRHFGDELFQKLVSRFARGIHDRIAVFERVGAGAAGEFGISEEPRSAVAGNVELGHDANPAIVRVGDQVANFCLRVELSVGALARELGKYFAFGAKTLVVGEMPVQHVHLYRSHCVEIALEYIEWNEVAADVDQRAAPGKAGLIFDRYGGRGEAGRCDVTS